MEDEPDVPGGGYHRPLRKRTRTARALESEQQNGDMEWQEEESSEGALSHTRTKKRTTPKAVGSMTEAIQGLKRLLEQDFNKRMETMKAEFQLEFTKLSDRMAEEVTRTTAQIAQELSQAREQLTLVCSELEQARLQLDTLTNTHAARSPSQTYADAARMTPISITTQTPSTVRSATSEPVFCTVDTSRVPEDHIGDATPACDMGTAVTTVRSQSSWGSPATTRFTRSSVLPRHSRNGRSILAGDYGNHPHKTHIDGFLTPRLPQLSVAGPRTQRRLFQQGLLLQRRASPRVNSPVTQPTSPQDVSEDDQQAVETSRLWLGWSLSRASRPAAGSVLRPSARHAANQLSLEPGGQREFVPVDGGRNLVFGGEGVNGSYMIATAGICQPLVYVPGSSTAAGRNTQPRTGTSTPL
ncbi:hypothetical protein AUP68_04092 [Ilyonectria robusta]